MGRRAAAASSKADQLRAAGDAVGADKLDALAKVALEDQFAELDDSADDAEVAVRLATPKNQSS